MIAPTIVTNSIRTRLLVLLLGLITMTVVLISVLSVVNIFTAGRNAERVGNVTLRAQAEEYLINLTMVTAENHDLEFERARHDVAYISEYANNLFNHPERFNPSTYWKPEEYLSPGKYGHLYSRDGDFGTTIVVPASVGIDRSDQLAEKLALLDVLFKPIFHSHSNAILVYLFAKNGVARAYPFFDQSDFAGGAAPTMETVSPLPFFSMAAPENNPDREVVMTSEYEEILGLGLLVTASSPVYTDDGEFVGVVGLDLSMTALTKEIEAASPVAGGYSFLMSESGQLIALSEARYQDVLGRSREPTEVGPDVSEVIAPFVPVAASMQNGETGYQNIVVNDRELSVAYAPMLSTGWSLAHVVETDALFQVLRDLETELDGSTQSLIFTRVLPVGGAILIAALALSLWLTGRLIDPLRRLTLAARQIGEGRWDEPLSSAGDTSTAADREDEVGELARSFQDMSEQLRASFSELQTSNRALQSAQDELQEANEGLEQRVVARTQEMAAFFDVTMLTSESQEMSDLLGPALSRILDVGGCQAACIHLRDEDGNDLSLVAHRGLGQDEIGQIQTISGQEGFGEFHDRPGDPILASDLQNSTSVPQQMKMARFQAYMGAQLRARGSPQGILSCLRESNEMFSTNEVSLIVALSEQLGVVVENHRLYQNTRSMAVLEERERLARDMHDSVTQSLYGLNLFARAGREAIEDQDMGKLEQSLEQMEAHSLTALKEMRLSLYHLQAARVEDEGLIPALEDRLDSVERRLGVESDLQIVGSVDVPVEVATELYHIATEALNNTLRHADATTVTVSVTSNGSQTVLQIVDNGRGFDTSQSSPGMGLSNIRARAEVLSSKLDVQSAPGEGTRIQVTIDNRLEGPNQ